MQQDDSPSAYDSSSAAAAGPQKLATRQPAAAVNMVPPAEPLAEHAEAAASAQQPAVLRQDDGVPCAAKVSTSV